MRGFTLVELLLVVAILAILIMSVVFIINPAESTKRARDVQRITDLDILKTAIILWTTEGNTDIGGDIDGSCCIIIDEGVICDSENICFSNECGGEACEPGAKPTQIDGSGWIPIDFLIMAGGSPLSHLPIDPVANNGYKYCYAANGIDFELNARMESEYYRTKDRVMENDGGNNDYIYEKGTNLNIIECCFDEDCAHLGAGYTCSNNGACEGP